MPEKDKQHGQRPVPHTPKDTHLVNRHLHDDLKHHYNQPEHYSDDKNHGFVSYSYDSQASCDGPVYSDHDYGGQTGGYREETDATKAQEHRLHNSHAKSHYVPHYEYADDRSSDGDVDYGGNGHVDDADDGWSNTKKAQGEQQIRRSHAELHHIQRYNYADKRSSDDDGPASNEDDHHHGGEKDAPPTGSLTSGISSERCCDATET